MTQIRCSNCFAVILRGMSRKFSLPTRIENLTNTIEQAGPKVVDQVISSLLKRKLGNEESNLSLVQPYGDKPVGIVVGNKNIESLTKKTLLSADDFLKIQMSTHLSQRKKLEIAKTLRVATKNSKVIEPKLQKQFSIKSFYKNFRSKNIYFHEKQGAPKCIRRFF